MYLFIRANIIKNLVCSGHYAMYSKYQVFEHDPYSYDLRVWEEQAWGKLSTRKIPGLPTVWVEHNETKRERREPTKA